MWTLYAVGETAETVGVAGGSAGVALLLNWLFNKYSEWRKDRRAETKEDRDERRKERKEDESATIAIMRETVERLERERERERRDAEERRKEDRQEVHVLRDRMAANEYRVNRMRVWIRHLQALLVRHKIEFEPYSDDPHSDTDVHRTLMTNSGEVPTDAAETPAPRPKEPR